MTAPDRHTHRPTQCSNLSMELSPQGILGCVKLMFKNNPLVTVHLQSVNREEY